MHENKAQVRPVTEGMPFLGFVVYPEHRLLKRRKGIYFRRQINKRLAEFHAGAITFEQLKASIIGWINHVSYGDTWGLREALFEDIKICFAERTI